MATATKYFTGDTIRMKATFRDWVPASSATPGTLIDPDTVEVNIYDSELTLLQNIPDGNPKITNPSIGVYLFDWVLPLTNGNYFFEFKGVYSDPQQLEPCIVRTKIAVQFKPVDS